MYISDRRGNPVEVTLTGCDIKIRTLNEILLIDTEDFQKIYTDLVVEGGPNHLPGKWLISGNRQTQTVEIELARRKGTYTLAEAKDLARHLYGYIKNLERPRR